LFAILLTTQLICYHLLCNKFLLLIYQYKKQQRLIEHKLSKGSYQGIVVLSIDQCQGQEADYVIISLVQKPTGFLNKNRLNVALSRVRQKLYMVGDREEFASAIKEDVWECRSIASDLLRLPSSTFNGDRIDEQSYECSDRNDSSDDSDSDSD
jgi:superfamily I DNA and/or RNA helicase